MYRTILDVPRTCPIPALCWDLGGVLMKLRIEQKKLEFLWHLLNLDEGTLAREIFNVQITHSMPGLVSECKGLIKELALPDIFNEKLLKTQWKKIVKDKILEQNEKNLKLKMMKLEKLKQSDLVNEEFGIRPYIKNLSVLDARTIFKKRSSMLQNVKMNYMSDYRNVQSMWSCSSCQSSIDSMGHVLWCPSYQELRIGKDMKNDKDLAKYLHDVLVIRSKLEKDK